MVRQLILPSHHLAQFYRRTKKINKKFKSSKPSKPSKPSGVSKLLVAPPKQRCVCEPAPEHVTRAFQPMSTLKRSRTVTPRQFNMVAHLCYPDASSEHATEFVASLNQLLNRTPPAPYGIRNRIAALQARMRSNRRTAEQLNTYSNRGRSMQVQFNMVTTVINAPLETSLLDREEIADYSPKIEEYSGKNVLNVWIVDSTDYLGIASFPWEDNSAYHGVVLDYRTISSRYNSQPYHQNKTAVHEIGHWLGLLHTFSAPQQAAHVNGFATADVNGQTGLQMQELMGDLTPDTAPQATPTYGNPLVSRQFPRRNSQLSCFVSYMDYSDDPALLLFTKDQVERAHAMMDAYYVD